MPIFEIFLAAAPEIIGGAEALGAGVEGLTALEAAGALGAGAGGIGGMLGMGAEGLGAGSLASAAVASPEILGPNVLAELTQQKAIESGLAQGVNNGIMSQGVNPALTQSIADYAPQASMSGPGSEQLAANSGFNLSKAASQIPTPEQIGNFPGGSTPPTIQNINQFPTPNEIGSYPGGSTSPTTLDMDRFPTPNQTGSYPGGSSIPTTDNLRTSKDIRNDTANPLMRGLNQVTDWAKENPFPAAGAAYMGASKLGLLDQKGINAQPGYSGPLSKYHLSPDFQGNQVNPVNYQYTPRQYNAGGIAQIPGYAKGSTVDSSYWTDMIDQKQPELPVYRGEIARDDDPDTRYLDPLTAAMVRQSKVEGRSYVNTPAKFNKPTPMGALNFKPVAAAQGGIMSGNLGGYAAGGNPRLLRGPGDGMSDNIPATINNRQPARLADGEFVVPADVVSHLGNGSTEAGANRLHEMMTEIRKARTGNPKQGKQINPNKYIPK